MKVGQLIAQLKKLPKNLRVGVAHHDNNEEECAGWVFNILEFDKEDFDIDDVEDKQIFEDMPDRCVILRC